MSRNGTTKREGHLKLFLGYAAGVGKTYKMLEEARQLSKDGHDVVIGYFEPHGRNETIAKTEGLETVPRQKIEYRHRVFEEMDAPTIVRRRPEICLVDELAHTNVPGTERLKRWEDVMALLAEGIDVMSTMNVQHIESLNDRMREITGIEVRETVPDWVVKRADQIVLVDLPPQALLNRLQRGVVYAPEKAKRAMENFFKEHILGALREVAMRQIAHEVEIRQSEPISPALGIGEQVADPKVAEYERILIHISEAPSTAALIRRGRRVADYLRGDCIAVCVTGSGDLHELEVQKREQVEKYLEFARKLRIEIQVIKGTDAAAAIVEFARRSGVTQIFLSKPEKQQFRVLALRALAIRVIRLANDMQVTVVAPRRQRR
jgi:two-component system sensor histidine kinase KdpD